MHLGPHDPGKVPPPKKVGNEIIQERENTPEHVANWYLERVRENREKKRLIIIKIILIIIFFF